MKRMIRSETTVKTNDGKKDVDSCSDTQVSATSDYAHERSFLEQYVEDLLEDGQIDENRAADALRIDWDITADDAEIMILSDEDLSNVKSVSYAIEYGEDHGYDGAYYVRFNDGSEDIWCWYFNDPIYYSAFDLKDEKPLHASSDIDSIQQAIQDASMTKGRKEAMLNMNWGVDYDDAVRLAGVTDQSGMIVWSGKNDPISVEYAPEEYLSRAADAGFYKLFLITYNDGSKRLYGYVEDSDDCLYYYRSVR